MEVCGGGNRGELKVRRDEAGAEIFESAIGISGRGGYLPVLRDHGEIGVWNMSAVKEAEGEVGDALLLTNKASSGALCGRGGYVQTTFAREMGGVHGCRVWKVTRKVGRRLLGRGGNRHHRRKKGHHNEPCGELPLRLLSLACFVKIQQCIPCIPPLKFPELR